jgi:RND family efflux transporter MFP subunit
LTTAENDLRATEAAARLHQTATNPSNREATAARVKQAADRLANLDTQLSYAVIRAPFAGIITDQFQFEGEFAAAGAKLVNIADVSEVIVKAPISDTVAADLKDGDPVTVLPQESPDEKIEAKISLISRASDPQNRAVEIWVRLENKGGHLRANSAAKVAVTTQTASDTLIVPAPAVTLEATNTNEGTVMVVEENPANHETVAHERKVTVGIRTADQTEITSGLKEGETVVTEGNYALPDKTKVEINTGGDEEDEGGKEEGGGAGGAAPGGGTATQPDKATDNGTQPNQPNPGGSAKPNQGTSDNSTPNSGGTKNPATAPNTETAPNNPGGSTPQSPSGKGQGGGAKSSTGSQSSPNTKAGSGAKPAPQPGGKP